MPSIRFEQVSFAYDQNMVFDHLDLKLPTGSFIALTGPNGSGKSTLLKFLFRQLKPETGVVYLGDLDVAHLSQKELARKLGFVAQNGKLDYAFSVEEAVRMGRFAYGGVDETDHAEHAMRVCDIWDLKHKLVTELSGGEMQRVLLARALCQNGNLLLLDEPVNHLDVRHQRAMMELLGQLVLQGYTVVCVLHDLLLVQVYSQIALVLKKGKVVSYGPTQEVFNASLLEDVYHIKAHQVYDPTLGRSLWMPTWKETHENV
ncbi:MAG: ABC transporter ATP-binding protein [Spirochaetales bacterium]|nr:ABC transporter ATP-binding protein [Spirochaetales bacterium]